MTKGSHLVSPHATDIVKDAQDNIYICLLSEFNDQLSLSKLSSYMDLS